MCFDHFPFDFGFIFVPPRQKTNDQKYQCEIYTPPLLLGLKKKITVKTDDWHHIAYIYSDFTSLADTYLDSQKCLSGILPEKVHPFFFMAIEVKRQQNASLAEIGAWKRALEPVEVQSIYRQKTSLGKIDLAKGVLERISQM
ncbi:unnamed protein product [Didymodactylos carnosus]|uniref:Uncharacterized protein n=1 Tax=Didymodactylos carnosus TaxID=1234261 RepID=A0A814QVC7_9BILA|nr:unnamed protein product [Didymodactylos carnosus]CAF1125122.1 unnamed protein product [Didymodactylos carnosus]CAF3703499.1 unnamed protein product [Didymodactylos carnosus]CAF3888658.1 unnamed protein product [Didymodactylos carnosus]